MVVLLALIIAAGAFVLWFMPLPRDRTKRLASQVGGTVLFGIGLVGIVMRLMGPIAT